MHTATPSAVSPDNIQTPAPSGGSLLEQMLAGGSELRDEPEQAEPEKQSLTRYLLCKKFST